MMELYVFYAGWCGPCEIMKPIVEEFEKAHPEVKVKHIDIDKEVELAEKYRVANIPCLVALKDGTETKRIVGVTSIKKIEKMLEK